eukprot:m.67605 g.67605  ORF g.67605 m.67605 type:complete len:196 (+) comp35455_c0_seq1:2-589(+)
MDGLQLLPLKNGSFTTFSQRAFYENTVDVYIVSPDYPPALFPGLEEMFVDQSIGPQLYQKLSSQQCCNALRLGHLTEKDVPGLWKRILPAEWVEGTNKLVIWTPGKHGQPTKNWIESIWYWLADHPKCIASLTECNVIPCNNFTRLAQLSRQSNVIFAKHECVSVSIVPDLASALENVGCIVLQNYPDYISPILN